MTSYDSVLTAKYTGDGLRAWKQPGATGKRYFLYDGTLPIIEVNKDGEALAVNTFGANGLVSRTESLVSTFYTFDLQGSVAQRLDSWGNALSSHLFAAHGNEVTTPSADPFGYGAQWGYYTDREMGLQLLTHRYYDPTTGRFLTRDPISYRGGINLYAYVQNNPVNFIDPLGEDLFGFTVGGNGGAKLGPLGPLGTASYMVGFNTECSCGDFNLGGAGSAGFSGGEEYNYPHRENSRDTIGGGFGAGFGGGGGLFWSNAKKFSDLSGPFETTIINIPIKGPWGIGIEIDRSGRTWIGSGTISWGKGLGLFHLKTNTPKWSTWETKCVPVRHE